MNIVKARSLALRFTDAYPQCVKAIPCDVNQPNASLTMYLYVNTDGKGIPEDFREAAKKMFNGYQTEYVDLQRRQLSKIVTQLPAREERCEELRK